MKFRNRIGNLSLSFASVIGHILVLQMGISFLAMMIISIVVGIRLGVTPRDGAALMELVEQIYLKEAPLLLVGVHVMTLIVYGIWMIWIESRENGTPGVDAGESGDGGRKWGLLRSPIYTLSIGLIVLMGLGMSLFANGFGIGAQYIFPDAMKAFEEAMKAAGMGEEVHLLSGLAALVLAPIGEELLCRGVAFHYARKAFGGMKNERLAFWLANGIQAFLFGVFHLVFIQAVYAFVLGLVLGWLRDHYKSLYPSMLGHFVVNCLAMAWPFILGQIPGGDSLGGGVACMMAGLALILSMGRVIARKDRELLWLS